MFQGHDGLPEEATEARGGARGGVRGDAGLLEEAAEPRGLPAVRRVPPVIQDLLQPSQREEALKF